MTTLPKINLNGTKAESLLSEYKDVLHMLRTAQHFLTKATCHGRDFQCNDPDDFKQALFERAEVIAKIEDGIDYCEAWIINASDAIPND
tara:strand:+ start:254 stop:520 length:267 start_codon:yes stop_codon:yes gene_type:complete